MSKLAFLDALTALIDEPPVDLKTHRAGAERLRGHDHDPAVSAAKIVEQFARSEFSEFEHAFDDSRRSRIVRRQIWGLGLIELGVLGRDQRQTRD